MVLISTTPMAIVTILHMRLLPISSVKKRQLIKWLPIFLWYMVYVCSPYAGDIKNNVKNAKVYSRFLIDKNAIPITPHLLYLQFMDDGNERERAMAMHFNYVLLGKCTELWVFDGVVSRGMTREIGVAKKRRMKIKWFDHAMKKVNEYA